MQNPENDAEPTHCEVCRTSWDKIKRDGRVGCQSCYETFRAALAGVMARVQRGDFHTGKTPRAAQKRARLAVNLHKRRESQLQLLQNRLKAAIVAEKYEVAAQLRDKIQEISE